MKTNNISEIGSCLPHGRFQKPCICLSVVQARENRFGVSRIHSTVSGEVINFWEGDNLTSRI